MKKLFSFLILILFLAACGQSSEQKMAKNLIKVLESADNAGKYEELKDHLDPKFLSTLGLTPEGYIDELKKFSGENHGTVEYELASFEEVEDRVHLLSLRVSREKDGKKSEDHMDVILRQMNNGKDWFFTPMDMLRSYVFKANTKKEYFQINIPFVAEGSRGQTYVVELSNNSENIFFYFTPKSKVEVETSKGSCYGVVKEMELKPGESKRTNLWIPRAKGEPKKITIWSMADEQRYFDYQLILEIQK